MGKGQAQNHFDNPVVLWVIAMVVPMAIFVLRPILAFKLPYFLVKATYPYGFFVPGILLFAARRPPKFDTSEHNFGVLGVPVHGIPMG